MATGNWRVAGTTGSVETVTIADPGAFMPFVNFRKLEPEETVVQNQIQTSFGVGIPPVPAICLSPEDSVPAHGTRVDDYQLFQPEPMKFTGFNEAEHVQFLSECQQKNKGLISLCQCSGFEVRNKKKAERNPSVKTSETSREGFEKNFKMSDATHEAAKVKVCAGLMKVPTNNVKNFSGKDDETMTSGLHVDTINELSTTATCKAPYIINRQRVKKEARRKRVTDSVSKHRKAVYIPRRYSKEERCPNITLGGLVEDEDFVDIGMLPPSYPKMEEWSPIYHIYLNQDNLVKDKEECIVLNDTTDKSRMTSQRSSVEGGMFEISSMLWSGRLDTEIMGLNIKAQRLRHREEMEQVLEKHRQNLSDDLREREKRKQELELITRSTRSRSDRPPGSGLQCIQCGKLGCCDSQWKVFQGYLCRVCLKSSITRLQRQKPKVCNAPPPSPPLDCQHAEVGLESDTAIATKLKSFGTDVVMYNLCDTTGNDNDDGFVPHINGSDSSKLKIIQTVSPNDPSTSSIINGLSSATATQFNPPPPSLLMLATSSGSQFSTHMQQKKLLEIQPPPLSKFKVPYAMNNNRAPLIKL